MKGILEVKILKISFTKLWFLIKDINTPINFIFHIRSTVLVLKRTPPHIFKLNKDFALYFHPYPRDFVLTKPHTQNPLGCF